MTLQVGGSDQWGNITAGTDLTRKMHGEHVFGMTTPLVTDSNGKKFGKTAGGTTIFIDPEMTSPYQMYQFLLNSEDSSVVQYLKFFTFLSLEEIAELEKQVESEPHKRAAQKKLAQEVVQFVHGIEGLRAANQATEIFFGAEIKDLSDAQLAGIFADVPLVLTKAK